MRLTKFDLLPYTKSNIRSVLEFIAKKVRSRREALTIRRVSQERVRVEETLENLKNTTFSQTTLDDAKNRKKEAEAELRALKREIQLK
jgi:hypothetical protein